VNSHAGVVHALLQDDAVRGLLVAATARDAVTKDERGGLVRPPCLILT